MDWSSPGSSVYGILQARILDWVAMPCSRGSSWPRDQTRVSCLLCWQCKTQNSGLRSKEEKPRDPINQPSRCNTQEGLLSFAQAGDSDLLGGRAPRTANWASFICSMLHTGYKVIGYTFAKQSYWYKLRGLLFKFKAILLVQTAWAFFTLRRPWASQLSRWLFTGCTLIGRLQVTWWGRGIPPFHGKRNPSPGPLPAPAPGSPT